MPEAVDFRPGSLSIEDRYDAVFGDDFEAPGQTGDPDKRRYDVRDHCQHKTLGECESGAGFDCHLGDFSAIAEKQIVRLAQEYRSQRRSSGKVARLPYIRIPTR